jgi:preprotein translocase subunit SecY
VATAQPPFTSALNRAFKIQICQKKTVKWANSIVSLYLNLVYLVIFIKRVKKNIPIQKYESNKEKAGYI